MYTFNTQTYTGVVRSFNWEMKYGFIDVINPDGDDAHEFLGQVFAHVSQISPRTNMRVMDKKLITGELVRFEIGPSQNGQREQRDQAINIRGIYGLPLICEHGAVEFQRYTNVLRLQHDQGDTSAETPAADTEGEADMTV